MNKIKIMLVMTVAILISGAVVFLGNLPTIGAAETCNIVTVRGRSGLEPNLLTIKKGDCVVWINFTGSASKGEEVQLTFKEGEKCVRATKAPVGFKTDVPSGCYVAGWMNYGQTASLMFTEPGTYTYQVDFKVGGNTSGTIVVK